MLDFPSGKLCMQTMNAIMHFLVKQGQLSREDHRVSYLEHLYQLSAIQTFACSSCNENRLVKGRSVGPRGQSVVAPATAKKPLLLPK